MASSTTAPACAARDGHDAADRERLLALVDTADVFVENLAPGEHRVEVRLPFAMGGKAFVVFTGRCIEMKFLGKVISCSFLQPRHPIVIFSAVKHWIKSFFGSQAQNLRSNDIRMWSVTVNPFRRSFL